MSLPIQLAADLLLNVKDVNKAQREIESTVGGAAVKGLSSAIKKSQKLMKTEYSKAYQDSLRLGHKEQAAALKAQWKETRANTKANGEAVLELNKQIAASNDKAEKKRLKARRKGLEDEIKLQQSAFRSEIAERASAQEDLVKMLDEGMEKAGRKFEDKASDAADTFTDLVNKGLTLDNPNPSERASRSTEAAS